MNVDGTKRSRRRVGGGQGALDAHLEAEALSDRRERRGGDLALQSDSSRNRVSTFSPSTVRTA